MKSFFTQFVFRDSIAIQSQVYLNPIRAVFIAGVAIICCATLPVLAQTTYVETVCPGEAVDPVPLRGQDYSDVGGRIIRRTTDKMMKKRGGVDIAKMDSNWSSLACDMTFGEVDSLINIVWSIDLLDKQGVTHEVVLVLGKRQLVFQSGRLVRALGPSAIEFGESNLEQN